jgi:hypothetical protein
MALAGVLSIFGFPHSSGPALLCCNIGYPFVSFPLLISFAFDLEARWFPILVQPLAVYLDEVFCIPGTTRWPLKDLRQGIAQARSADLVLGRTKSPLRTIIFWRVAAFTCDRYPLDNVIRETTYGQRKQSFYTRRSNWLFLARNSSPSRLNKGRVRQNCF